MTQLTQQEIEMIEREAADFASKYYYKQNHEWWIANDTHKECAIKYLTQLKEERERAGKLLETLEYSANNYPEWNVDEQKYDSQICAQTAITEYKNNNQ